MSKQKNQNTEVETPKTEIVTEEPKVKATPVMERQYRLISSPSIPVKGKQRQIVMNILASAAEPMTVKQVAELATQAGLVAVGGVEPSCRYHLHFLVKLGFAKVVNPIATAIAA